MGRIGSLNAPSADIFLTAPVRRSARLRQGRPFGAWKAATAGGESCSPVAAAAARSRDRALVLPPMDATGSLRRCPKSVVETVGAAAGDRLRGRDAFRHRKRRPLPLDGRAGARGGNGRLG